MMMKAVFAVLIISAVTKAAPQGVSVAKTGYVAGHGGGEGSVHYESAGSGGAGAGIFGFLGVQKHVGRATEVVSEKVIDVEVESPPALPGKKTVIERTVIPQYVEKTVRVPTYVEKTIRVPTYVEKTIKVPAAPTIVEKEISHEEVPVPKEEVKVVQHKVHTAPVVHHKVVSAGPGPAYGGGGFSFSAGGGGGGRGGLFDAIFNIPIQTLGAVNGFLNGLAGNVRVSASKGYSYY